MMQKNKYLMACEEISFNNYLVHASIIDNIEVLEPRTNNKLFASDNLCFCILTALRKYNYPQNYLRLWEYSFFKNFLFCSIAEDFLEIVKNIKITIYYVKKSNFVFLKKNHLKSNIFSLTNTYVNEYISDYCVFPSNNISFTIDDFFTYSIHKIDDSRGIILLKLIKNYLTRHSS